MKKGKILVVVLVGLLLATGLILTGCGQCNGRCHMKSTGSGYEQTHNAEVSEYCRNSSSCSVGKEGKKPVGERKSVECDC